MTYSASQLEHLWIQAGGSPDKARVAAAIALAESSGRATVTSNNPDKGQNVGLWQIDTTNGYTNLTDPLSNARAAVKLSRNGTNWSDWQTYTEGTYEKFLPSGTTPNKPTTGTSKPKPPTKKPSTDGKPTSTPTSSGAQKPAKNTKSKTGTSTVTSEIAKWLGDWRVLLALLLVIIAVVS